MTNQQIKDKILEIADIVVSANMYGENLILEINNDMLCINDGNNGHRALPITRHGYIYWKDYWESYAEEFFNEAIEYLKERYK